MCHGAKKLSKFQMRLEKVQSPRSYPFTHYNLSDRGNFNGRVSKLSAITHYFLLDTDTNNVLPRLVHMCTFKLTIF